MTDIVFQLARADDLDDLLPLVETFYKEDHYQFDKLAIRSLLLRFVQNPSLGRAWFICCDGMRVGYVLLTFGYSLEYRGRDAFIDEIFIRDDYRNRGIGTATFQFVRQICIELGVQALHLEVERDNALAQRFYRKIGFEEHDRYLMTQQIFLAH
jgi:GNAT superfamily N-acetyltransferase